jgi:hypothetical protein
MEKRSKAVVSQVIVEYFDQVQEQKVFLYIEVLAKGTIEYIEAIVSMVALNPSIFRRRKSCTSIKQATAATMGKILLMSIPLTKIIWLNCSPNIEKFFK